MLDKTEIIFQKHKVGIGRRKQAVAQVFLVPGTGNIIINNTPATKYLQYNYFYLNNILSPLKTLHLDKQFDIIAIVKGGGITGQTDSIQLGLARLLCKMNESNRKLLKPEGVLTRDARIKERKKYGLRKARKAPQYSKR